MSEETPFDLTTNGNKLSISELQAALETIWQKVCDVYDNPPEPVPAGVVLTDGTVPMDGCLSLPPGCSGDDHAASWGAIKDYLDSLPSPGGVQYEAFTFEGATDLTGCMVVPFSGFAGAPVVSVSQSGLSANAPQAPLGVVLGTQSTSTAGTVVCAYDGAGNPIAGQWVKFDLIAVEQ